MFSHPWSRQSLEDERNNETSLFLVPKGKRVIGYIGMSIVIDEDIFSMLLCVEPEKGRCNCTDK